MRSSNKQMAMFLTVALLYLALSAVSVSAQVMSGGSYKITSSVQASGGGTSIGSGNQIIEGTAGQSAAVPQSAGSISHVPGFWPTTLAEASLPHSGPPALHFSASNYFVQEALTALAVTVTRSGDTSMAASVTYASSDASATQKSDYELAYGTLNFTPGEATKTFQVLINEDDYLEGPETLTLSLSNGIGAALDSPSIATVTITDDSPETLTNPIDDPQSFIWQQYHDFLSREPDQVGLQNWINTLMPCPNGGFGEPPTSDCDRLHAAAGFFQSDEYLNRGYWAFRLYMVAFNQHPTYAQFIPDMAQVGGPKSPAEEEIAKAAFANAFVQRPEFTAQYGNLSGQALANALLQTAGLPAGSYNAANQTNGQILRGVAETSFAFSKFLTEGTVSILYFGFQRRDPDTIGYQNNVNTLNANPNNLRHMIFIFIYSTEYRQRFGP